MPIAERHTFKSKDPVDRFIEQNRFYVKLRGKTYHPAMPVPRTLVSDCRQLAASWSRSLDAALPVLKRGIATGWKAIVKRWHAARKRLDATALGPNDVYDGNEGFWLSMRRLSGQLGALDMVMTRSEVLAWAVKETLAEHAETVQDAGREVLDTAASAVSAIPTIAKAFAVGAIGVGRVCGGEKVVERSRTPTVAELYPCL